MRTRKKLSEIEILEALKDYQWNPFAPMLHFSMHLNHSEGFVRREIKRLVAEGKVKENHGPWRRGKPYCTYQLIAEKENND